MPMALSAGRKRHVLPICRAEGAVHGVPAGRRAILVDLQRAILILDLHLFLLDEQVRGDVAAGDFAAVGAVTEVAALLAEELAVVDGHCYGAAKLDENVSVVLCCSDLCGKEHTQEPDMPLENSEGSCWLGSPVSSGILIEGTE